MHDQLKIGDKVRVQLKAADKGYKPKFRKGIHTIIKIDKNKQYFVDDSDRGYFRSNLIPVGEIEVNTEKPNLENTLEGHLKTMNRTRKVGDVPELNITERRVFRERKPVNQLIDTRYGNVKY